MPEYKNKELAALSNKSLDIGMCGVSFVSLENMLYYCHKDYNHKGVHFDGIQDHYFSTNFNAKKEPDWSDGLYV